MLCSAFSLFLVLILHILYQDLIYQICVVVENQDILVFDHAYQEKICMFIFQSAVPHILVVLVYRGDAFKMRSLLSRHLWKLLMMKFITFQIWECCNPKQTSHILLSKSLLKYSALINIFMRLKQSHVSFLSFLVCFIICCFLFLSFSLL